MNVYLLEKIVWDHREVLGVFATIELAEEFKLMYTSTRKVDPVNFPITDYVVFGG
jgi:hypothetical protein